MYETRFLPLNLQFFAEDAGDNDNNGGSGEGGQGDDQQNPGAQNGSADNTGDSGEKTVPQSKVNSLVATERRDTLKKLGDFESIDQAKEWIQKMRGLEESQKTEEQKRDERLQEFETQNQTLSSENESLKAQVAALKVGVTEESMEDVVTLAQKYVSDDVDLNAAIEKVIEKYPHFKEQQQKQDSPRWTNGNHQKPQLSDVEALEEQMKNAKTLPERVALRNKLTELKAKG